MLRRDNPMHHADENTAFSPPAYAGDVLAISGRRPVSQRVRLLHNQDV
jgi:hypothetical protein